MRTYTLVPEPVAAGLENSAIPESRDADGPGQVAEFEGEFELVLGKRQAASLTFLALVIVAVCSGGSYLIGRAISPSIQAGQAQKQAEVPDPPPVTLPVAEVLPQAALQEAPLFGSPLKGPIYIQLGAVDKGVATLLTHGARKLGFEAFVAQGTSPSVFRVLVGPFKSAADYDAALAKFKEIGLDNFSRRYQEQ